NEFIDSVQPSLNICFKDGSDCRKAEFKVNQGTLSLAKRPLFQNSPLDCFGIHPRKSASKAREFRRLRTATKALPLETASF
ncbi:hypothetical protein, partial [Porcipelethomonas sp.]|uniref:hypothetical protein n=1 Tax=Porcipelethomonas sp. TaxID=2981675 RepID=UPI003EF635DB